MRVQFMDLSRPKAAAKQLSHLDRKLSTCQEAVARATGYRDWHELAVISDRADNPSWPELDLSAAAQIVMGLADTLNLPDIDVQYAVSKARLLNTAQCTLHEQLRLRSFIWRHKVFGTPARGKPGTIIKVNTDGPTRLAYLSKPTGHPASVVYDTGPGVCADFEVVTPRKPPGEFVPSCLWLPYGFWTLGDGSEVVFSRDYFPLWRIASGVVERLDPWLWIADISAEAHFVTITGTAFWSKGPARELALQYLAEHCLSGVPPLVGVMTYLVMDGVESISDGVGRLHRDFGGAKPVPKYAGPRPWFATL